MKPTAFIMDSHVRFMYDSSSVLMMKLQHLKRHRSHIYAAVWVRVYPSCADVNVNTSSFCLLLTARTASDFFVLVPDTRGLSADCLSPAVLQHGSDLQAWGQQAIIQSLDVLLLISAQGWLRQLLLSTCQHPGVLRGDRIWRAAQQTPPKKRNK